MVTCNNTSRHHIRAHCGCVSLLIATEDWLCKSCVEEKERQRQPRVLTHLKNIPDLGSTCYASTVFQITHNIEAIATFVHDPSKFLFKPDEQSGRKPESWVPNKASKVSISKQSELQMGRAKNFIEQLREMFFRLDPAEKRRISRSDISAVFNALSSYDAEWQNQSNDSATLFLKVIEIIIYTSEDSEPRGRGKIEKLDNARTKAIQDIDRSLPPLQQDSTDYYMAYSNEGRASPMLGTFCVQVAKEWKCRDAGCTAIMRRWEHDMSLNLPLPQGSDTTATFDLCELLRQWTVEKLDDDNIIRGPRYGGLHPAGSNEIVRRIWICPKILPIHFSRQGFFGGTLAQGQYGGFLSNHVDMPEYLDMSPYINGVELPSEKANGRRAKVMTHTIYRLHSVDLFRPSGEHYIACTRTIDGSWAYYGNLKYDSPPIEKHPQSGVDDGLVPYWAVYIQTDLEALPERYFVLKAHNVPEGRIAGVPGKDKTTDPLGAGDGGEEGYSSPPLETFACPFAAPPVNCDQRFDSAEEARKHSFIHMKQNATCETCRQQFPNTEQLQKHIEDDNPELSGGKGKRGTEERPTTSDSTTKPPSKRTLALRAGGQLLEKMKLRRSKSAGEMGRGGSAREEGSNSEAFGSLTDLEGLLAAQGKSTQSVDTPMPDVTSSPPLTYDMLLKVQNAKAEQHMRTIKEASEQAETAHKRRQREVEEATQQAEDAHKRRESEAEAGHQRRLKEIADAEQEAQRAHQNRMTELRDARRSLLRDERTRLQQETESLSTQIATAQKQIQGMQQTVVRLEESRERIAKRLEEIEKALGEKE